MKTWMTATLGAALFALCLSLPAYAEEQDGQGDRPGMKRERGDMRKGRGQFQRSGQRQDRMKEMMEQIPGAEEEMKRHTEAREAIREKVKALAESIRDQVQQAETPEARQQILEGKKADFTALAGEMVDENLNHAQKMVDLRKANRDAVVDKIVERMMNAGQNRGKGQMGQGRDQGNRDGKEGMMMHNRPGERMERGRRGPTSDEGKTGAEEPESTAPAPEAGEMDLAEALEAALG